MLKGGGTRSCEVVLTQELESLATLMGGGGAQSFHSIKGGAQKVLPCFDGGGGGGSAKKVLDPLFSHFVDPLPVINDP